MNKNNNFSFFGDLIFPIIAVIASLPILIIFGFFRTVGDSCNHMAAWHAKDYIQKHW